MAMSPSVDRRRERLDRTDSTDKLTRSVSEAMPSTFLVGGSPRVRSVPGTLSADDNCPEAAIITAVREVADPAAQAAAPTKFAERQDVWPSEIVPSLLRRWRYSCR